MNGYTLSINENGHYFMKDSRPFFCIGDTAWTLFQKMNKNQAAIYMKNRKEKGFNCIFAVLINFQSKEENSSFDNREEKTLDYIIGEENKSFWDEVQTVVKMAEKLGLIMAILPVWGNVVRAGCLNESNAETYVKFLTGKFSDLHNIIWVVGGDCRGNEGYSVWNRLGSLLKENMPNTLIGYHPFGRTSSSYWFHDAQWLDFNLFQSGHRRSDQKSLNAWDESAGKEPWFGEESWRYVLQDYAKIPAKPVMDGEPSYEQIPQGLHNPDEPYWQDYHVRRYAYWAAFSGAAGHVYGHNSIIQFFGTGSLPVYGAKETWDISMHDVGSGQMQFLKLLMKELDFCNAHTKQNILAKAYTDVQEDTLLAFGTDLKFAVYNYCGRPIELHNINKTYDFYWFDPICGVRSYIACVNPEDSLVFIPPTKKSMWNDWVLLADSVTVSPQ